MKHTSTQELWQKKFEEIGAFWKYPGGLAPHVKTSMSGKHVDAYFNSDLVLCDPRLTREIIESVLIPEIEKLDIKLDWIVGYAPYSIFIAQLTADILGIKCGYTRPDLEFNTSFAIKPKDKVLVVADDIYGGGATLGTIATLEHIGAHVVPIIFCLANLSGKKQLDERLIVSASELKATKYSPHECKLCNQGSKALVPRNEWNKLQGKSSQR